MSKKLVLSKDTFDLNVCDKYTKDSLIEFAKELNLPYSGTKEKICQRIDEKLSKSKSKSKSPKKKKAVVGDDFDVTKCMTYTSAELKDFCKKYGLRVSGTKTELCDRLRDKFSCDLPDKDDDIFDPKKCEGDNPSYSKYELEKFAKQNKIKISSSDTKKDMCDKIVDKVDCSELEVVEVGSKVSKKKSSKKKKEVDIEIEYDSDDEPTPKKKKTSPKKKSPKKVSKKKKEVDIEIESDSDDEPTPKKKSPKKVSKKKDEFKDSKCMSYLKDELIAFSEEYGLDTKGTKVDLCNRLKKHLKGTKIPDDIKKVIDEVEKGESPKKKTLKKVSKKKKIVIIEELDNDEDEEPKTPKKSSPKKSKGDLEEILREKLGSSTKSEFVSIIEQYGIDKNIVSSEAFATFKSLDTKNMFIDMYVRGNNKPTFEEAINYFYPERSYRKFFSKYYIAVINNDLDGSDVIKSYGDLIGKYLDKFKSLGSSKRKSITKEYIENMKPFSKYITLRDCNKSGDGSDLDCGDDVCNIDLGQCVSKDDLDSDSKVVDIKGNKIVGNKAALDSLKKTLKIGEKPKPTIPKKKPVSPKVIIEDDDEPTPPKKKTPKKKPVSPKKKTPTPKKIKLDEGDEIREDEGDGEYQGDIILDSLVDIYGDLLKDKDRPKKKYDDKAENERKRKERAEAVEKREKEERRKREEREEKERAERKREEEDKEERRILEKERAEHEKEKRKEEKRKEEKRKEEKRKEEERMKQEEYDADQRRREEEKEREKDRKREEREEKERSRDEKERERALKAERKREEEERKEEELAERKRKEEAGLIKIGRDKVEDDKDIPKRVSDALKKKRDEDDLDELPSKEDLLKLAKGLSKPQQEIAKCLGLLG